MTSPRRSPKAHQNAAERAYRNQDYQTAAAAFIAASQAYQHAGQPKKSAEMASNASVAYLQDGQVEQAYAAIVEAPEIFLKGGDIRRSSLAFGNRANALEALGELERAEADYRRALEGFERISDKSRLRETRQALSALRLRQGRPMEALTEMQIGLEGQQQITVRDRVLRWLLRLPSRLLSR